MTTTFENYADSISWFEAEDSWQFLARCTIKGKRIGFTVLCRMPRPPHSPPAEWVEEARRLARNIFDIRSNER